MQFHKKAYLPESIAQMLHSIQHGLDKVTIRITCRQVTCSLQATKDESTLATRCPRPRVGPAGPRCAHKQAKQ